MIYPIKLGIVGWARDVSCYWTFNFRFLSFRSLLRERMDHPGFSSSVQKGFST